MSYEKTRDLLEEKYPKCFVPFGTSEAPKPLKKGIKDDILALMPEYSDILTKRGIRKYLTSYVNRPSYFRCIKTGAKRIDLSGAEVGEVTEDECNYTKTRQKERIEKFKQQKKDAATKKPEAESDDKQAVIVKPLQAELEKIKAQAVVKRNVLSLEKKVG